MFYRLQLLWSKFSNRWLWIIILLIFITWWIYYYNFIYLKEKSEKDDSLSLSNSWNIEKEIKLTKIESNNKSNDSSNVESKISKLKENLEYYKVIEVWKNIFYFKKNNDKLDLFKGDLFVSKFENYSKNNLDILSIYSSDNFLLKIWNNYYIYDLSKNNILKLDLFVDIEYVKQYNNKYIINTNKWSYVYDIKTKILDYFTFFEDFVYYKNSYIWIISKEDNIRKNNLWLEWLNKNSIYLYNPKTKEKNILYQTSISLEKIYYSWDEIFFEDDNGKVYKLENL